MAHILDPSLLELVDQCKEKNCLGENWQPCGCGIKLISDDLLEIENTHKCLPLCQYRLSFASNMYCNCPARIEMFKKYDI